MHKKGISCCVVRRTSGDYSDSIKDPNPMPVEITDPKEFMYVACNIHESDD